MKRFIKVISLILAAIFALTACSLVTVDPEKEKQLPIAQVNDVTITKAAYTKEYESYLTLIEQQYGITKETIETSKDYADMLKQIKENLVDELINRELIKEQIKKNNIVLTDDDNKDIADTIQQLKDSYGEETFTDMLKQQNTTEEELKQTLQENMLQQKLLDKLTANITVSDEEIKKYYDENKDTEFTEPEKVTVSHILIAIPEDKMSADDNTKNAEYEKIKPKAEQVLAKAKAGEDFSKLVKEYSDDTGTKDQGGQLTFSRSDQIEQAFMDASFALKNIGDISNLVKTSYGYHIIKLDAKTPAKVYTLEEKKNDIKEEVLQQKKSDKFTALLDEWKKASSIKKYTKNYL